MRDLGDDGTRERDGISDIGGYLLVCVTTWASSNARRVTFESSLIKVQLHIIAWVTRRFKSTIIYFISRDFINNLDAGQPTATERRVNIRLRRQVMIKLSDSARSLTIFGSGIIMFKYRIKFALPSLNNTSRTIRLGWTFSNRCVKHLL